MPRIPGQSDARFHTALANAIREVVEFPSGLLVTVVDAHLTPDTKHATGTLSVLPDGREGDALQALRKAEHDLKDALADILELRRIPKIHWRFDSTEAEAAVIEAALNKLEKEGEL
ncbi:MAG: Ribosome-binding factor [Candidatus Parcubacteria bacterium]